MHDRENDRDTHDNGTYDRGTHRFTTSAESDVRIAYIEQQIENIEALLRREVTINNDAIRREVELLRGLLDERYAVQTKAVDAAFTAQQTAISAALAAAEKAVDKVADNLQREFHEHLIQYRHEVTLAFESSDRAITKAEMSTEKRFESVNEFRAQLGDQASRFLGRAEYYAAHNALVAKVEEQAKHQTERLTEINRRLDLNQGKSSGVNAVWGFIVAGVSLLVAIIGVVAYFNAG